MSLKPLHVSKNQDLHIKDAIVIFIMASSLLIGIFFSDGFDSIMKGFEYIFKSPHALVNDYILYAGIGAALVNATLTTFVSYMFVRVIKKDLSDIDFACLLTIFGFAVLGKNIFAILPIFAGTFLAAANEKKPVKTYVTVALLATALSPVVMFCWNYAPFVSRVGQPVAYIIGTLAGMAAGFITVYISKIAPNFHKGLTLYNVGFTSGLVATILNGVLATAGVDTKNALTAGAEIVKVSTPDQLQQYKYIFLIWFLVIGLFALIMAMLSKAGSVKDLLKIMDQSGRAPQFSNVSNNAAVIFNVGLLFVMGTLVVFLLGSTFEAIAFAGVFTFAGFGAYGKHPKNVFPVMIGICIAWFVIWWSAGFPTEGSKVFYGNRTAMGAILFGTALAPVAGIYGFGLGVVAGFIHVAVVNQLLSLHTFTLYHNGFATGFVAFIMQGIAIIFKKDNFVQDALPNSFIQK